MKYQGLMNKKKTMRNYFFFLNSELKGKSTDAIMIYLENQDVYSKSVKKKINDLI